MQHLKGSCWRVNIERGKETLGVCVDMGTSNSTEKDAREMAETAVKRWTNQSMKELGARVSGVFKLLDHQGTPQRTSY